MTRDQMKQAVAKAALQHIEPESIIGVGTGTTVNFFIDALAEMKHRLEGAVASSEETADRLREKRIRVFDLNLVNRIPLYIDGADEINPGLQMIKGGGGALTREKILASASENFICIADETKRVNVLGKFPLAIEVIPMARSYVGREIVKLGGSPAYREGAVTDNGNIIIDVYNLKILEPIKLEQALNNIAGIVCHGLFALRPANMLLLGTASGVEEIRAK